MADRSGNNKKKVNQGATLKKVFERLGKYRIFSDFLHFTCNGISCSDPVYPKADRSCS